MSNLIPVQIKPKAYSELCKCLQSHIEVGTVLVKRTINTRTKEESVLPYLKKGRREILVQNCPSCGVVTTKEINEVATVAHDGKVTKDYAIELVSEAFPDDGSFCRIEGARDGVNAPSPVTISFPNALNMSEGFEGEEVDALMSLSVADARMIATRLNEAADYAEKGGAK